MENNDILVLYGVDAIVAKKENVGEIITKILDKDE